jgi:hypothetical protein
MQGATIKIIVMQIFFVSVVLVTIQIREEISELQITATGCGN